jgi:hypothetical protein
MKGDKSTKNTAFLYVTQWSLLAHNKILWLVCRFHPRGKDMFLYLIYIADPSGREV